MSKQLYCDICARPCIWQDTGPISKRGCQHARWCPKFEQRTPTIHKKKQPIKNS